MVGGTTTGATMAMIPVFEDGADAVHLARRRHPDHRAGAKWVFKTPHTDKMACEKIFGDLKARNLTKIALISGTDGSASPCATNALQWRRKSGIIIAHEEATARATPT